MEIWQHIEILRRPNKTWFFSKDNTEEKINALTKIANDGYLWHSFSKTEELRLDLRKLDSVFEFFVVGFVKSHNIKPYYSGLF